MHMFIMLENIKPDDMTFRLSLKKLSQQKTLTEGGFGIQSSKSMWWLSKTGLESHLMCIVTASCLVSRLSDSIHWFDSSIRFIDSIHCFHSLIRFIDSILEFDSLIRFLDSIHWFDSLIRFFDSNHWFDSLIRFLDSIHWFDSLIRFLDSIHGFDSLIRFLDSILEFDSLIRFLDSIHWFDSNCPVALVSLSRYRLETREISGPLHKTNEFDITVRQTLIFTVANFWHYINE